jgi:hypothetical protein
MEQSCQGAAYYKQPILVRESKQDLSPAAIWNFKNAGTVPFLESPTERVLQRMAKLCRFPREARTTGIDANIGGMSDTVHSQVLSHHVQQKRLLEIRAPN